MTRHPCPPSHPTQLNRPILVSPPSPRRGSCVQFSAHRKIEAPEAATPQARPEGSPQRQQKGYPPPPPQSEGLGTLRRRPAFRVLCHFVTLRLCHSDPPPESRRRHSPESQRGTPLPPPKARDSELSAGGPPSGSLCHSVTWPLCHSAPVGLFRSWREPKAPHSPASPSTSAFHSDSSAGR